MDEKQREYNRKALHWIFGIGIILVSVIMTGLGCSFGCSSNLIILLPGIIMSVSGIILIKLGYTPSKKLWIWFAIIFVLGVIYSKTQF